jgi:allophanate hydrolase subunit 2
MPDSESPLNVSKLYGGTWRVGPVRPPRRRFGVPVGGPFDRTSARLASDLAGGPNVLELIGRCEGTFAKAQHIAWAGALLEVRIAGAAMPHCAAAWVREGETFLFQSGGFGYRAYIAWSEAPGLSQPTSPAQEDDGPIRVLSCEGPFRVQRLKGRWQVSVQSDRRGVRLDGPFEPHFLELESEPMAVGAIQVTNAGQPIIIGPDGPTIGGYPVVGVVANSDLDRVGQLAPGSEVEFDWDAD